MNDIERQIVERDGLDADALREKQNLCRHEDFTRWLDTDQTSICCNCGYRK